MTDNDDILILIARRAGGERLNREEQAALDRAMLADPDLALLLLDAADVRRGGRGAARERARRRVEGRLDADARLPRRRHGATAPHHAASAARGSARRCPAAGPPADRLLTAC